MSAAAPVAFARRPRPGRPARLARPAGARSAIVYRDTGHAPELAARQGIGSADLAADGIVDQVIPETPADPGRFCRDLGHALHRALEDLANQGDGTRLAGRLRRYRRLGMSPHRRPLPALPQPGGRPCRRSPYR
jgi:acyl-CoA carboxylase subunit beta